ncbi:MAG: hypothetical protein ABRQ26_13725 [Syntrophomonadaceae bacterium]
MKAALGYRVIAPIQSAEAYSESNHPKAKVLIPSSKQSSKQSSFITILSAMVNTDNSIYQRKPREKG